MLVRWIQSQQLPTLIYVFDSRGNKMATPCAYYLKLQSGMSLSMGLSSMECLVYGFWYLGIS